MSNVEDRAIVTWNMIVFGEHGMGAGTTVIFDGVEVDSSSMGSQDNITGAIDNAVIGISHNIVK